uniref:Uncharacterized protein n=1 Tax=Heterorhabditis bacteriophora TaxID=37862 RepID=A0A1I7XTC9_HETBA
MDPSTIVRKHLRNGLETRNFNASRRLCRSSGACGCCGCRAKAKARGAQTNVINGDEITEDDRDDGNIFGLAIWNKTDIVFNRENIKRYTASTNIIFIKCLN